MNLFPVRFDTHILVEFYHVQNIGTLTVGRRTVFALFLRCGRAQKSRISSIFHRKSLLLYTCL